jgi:vacuolar iron transporter family protein
MADPQALIKQLRSAWRDEMSSARNYRALAAREPSPPRREIFEKLAEQEDRHAANWAARLRELGADPGLYNESLLERARRWTLLQGGTDSAVNKLEKAERAADATYEVLMGLAPSDAVRQQILEAQQEERVHSRLLNEMTNPAAPGVQSRLERLLSAEKWHVTAGGWIGQVIYGANDGLGAAFGVVSGVAGATGVNATFVLLSGIAAAVASALSMGSGAYLATKSEREVYEAEIERERREIETHPEEEIEEMALFYQLKGFPADEAHRMARRLAEQPEHLLKTLAHEELGLSERAFPNPWRAAVGATLSTAAGAFIPVIPYFFLHGRLALVASFIISTLAHFGVGAAKVIVTGRSWFKSGLEMTLVGLGEAFITYGIGVLIAPALH